MYQFVPGSFRPKNQTIQFILVYTFKKGYYKKYQRPKPTKPVHCINSGFNIRFDFYRLLTYKEKRGNELFLIGSYVL